MQPGLPAPPPGLPPPPPGLFPSPPGAVPEQPEPLFPWWPPIDLDGKLDLENFEAYVDFSVSIPNTTGGCGGFSTYAKLKGFTPAGVFELIPGACGGFKGLPQIPIPNFLKRWSAKATFNAVCPCGSCRITSVISQIYNFEQTVPVPLGTGGCFQVVKADLSVAVDIEVGICAT